MSPVYAHATLERGRTCWLWHVRRCPFCGRPHVHTGGALTGDPRPHLSSRIAHCAGAATRLYVLSDEPALQGLPVPARFYVEVA